MNNEIIKKSINEVYKIKSNINKENTEKLEKLYLKYPSIILKITIQKSQIFFKKFKKKKKKIILIKNFFEKINKNIKKDGVFYFHYERFPTSIPIEEMINLPLFCFSINLNCLKNNEENNLILLPNYFIMNKINDNLEPDNIQFEKKKSKAIWRFKDCNPIRHKKRIKLINTLNNDFFDIKMVGNDDAVNPLYIGEKYRLSINEMRNYKFLLDSDGWDAIFWKLNSKSIVVRFNNHLKTITFIDKYLKEDVHYINGDNKKNLEKFLKNIINNKEDCNNMIKKSNELIKIFTEDFMIEYSVNLIEKYFELV